MYGVAPLTPAYGRDYKSLKAAQADFDADKDFNTAMKQYVNRPQIKELGLKQIQVHFDKLRKTGMLKVK